MKTRVTSLFLAILLVGAAGAFALGPTAVDLAARGGSFVVDGGDIEAATFSLRAAASAASEAGPAPQATPAARPVAFEYSDGYYKRLKVHKYASVATLPLFVTQAALGQKLYSGDYGSGTRDAHTAVAIGTAALFGVNTVTGVMNFREARKDPNKSTRRKVHGILMLAADAGFVATGFLAPGKDGSGNRSAHRAVALTSMGVATAAYLVMLLGN